MVSPLQSAVVAILYLITGKLSFALFQQDMVVTITVFIPEGIALAAVLIYGYRVVLGIFLGQLLLALTSDLSLLPAFGISVTNALEAMIAYKLFHLFKLNKTLEHTRDLIGLFLLIVFALQPFSAIFGNTILLLSHTIDKNVFFQDLFFWWFGNVVGQLLTTPLVLLLYYNQQKSKISWHIFTLTFFALLNYTLQVEFDINNISLLLVTTLPLTIYLAARNLSYAVVAVFSLVVSTLYFFHIHHSAFELNSDTIDCLIDMNFFILSHIVLVPVIGILFREKESAIATLRSLAHYDSLTGLANRYVLHSEIERSVYLYERFQQESMICFIDVDGFKSINDHYGHDVGDKLLQEIAKLIQNNIRLTDTLIRFGGDEFVLILNNIDKAMAENLLGRILKAIREIKYIDQYKISISLSVGVACCPRDGTTEDTLLHTSDGAMYLIKNDSKDGIAFSKNCK